MRLAIVRLKGKLVKERRHISRVARFFSAYLVASRGWPWNRREVVYPKNATAASSHQSLKIARQPHAEAVGGAVKSKFSPPLFLSLSFSSFACVFSAFIHVPTAKKSPTYESFK